MLSTAPIQEVGEGVETLDRKATEKTTISEEEWKKPSTELWKGDFNKDHHQLPSPVDTILSSNYFPSADLKSC